MLTIDDLRRFGANVQDGMGRCMNDESFYLEMVRMTLNEKSFDKLSDAIRSGDRKGAFEAAHALKGVLANLSITPLYEKVCEITELLRARTDTDYSPLLSEIGSLKDELKRLIDSE